MIFKFVEQAFYQVPLLEEPPIGVTLNGSVLAAGNDGIPLLLLHLCDDFIGIIATVRNDVFTLDIQILKDLIAGHAIVHMARRHFVSQGIAQRVHNRMNLGG